MQHIPTAPSAYDQMIATMALELRRAAYEEGAHVRVTGAADVELDRMADGGRVDRRATPRTLNVTRAA